MELEYPEFYLSGLRFSMYTDSEIRKLSVKEVTNPQTFDTLLHPTHGGLHDPAFGPYDRDEVCTTCGQNNIFCPGHMGHIVLPLPVYNPVLFKHMITLLRGTCFSCHRLRIKHEQKLLLSARLRILEFGQIDALSKLQATYDEFLADRAAIVRAGDTETRTFNTEELQDILDDCVTAIIKDLDPEQARQSSRVKNIQALQQGYVKEFMSGALFMKTNCKLCGAAVRTLRSEHNSKVFFYKPASKGKKRTPAENHALRKKTEYLMRANSVPEVAEDEIEEVVMADAPGGDTEITKEGEAETHTYLTPSELQSHLQQVWEHDGALLQQVYALFRMNMAENEVPTDIFFLRIIPVTPTRFRPLSVMREQKYEHPHTAHLSRILQDKIQLQTLFREMDAEKTDPDGSTEVTPVEARGNTLTEKLQSVWLAMQAHVNAMIDSDMDKLSTDKLPGLRQVLEKKQGLFRKHMMGKRVNYAARSVISPDPYIATNEVGIPEVFAKKLTFPQPVTPWNFHEMKQAVINGPDVYPGATHVVNDDGQKIVLSKSHTQREAIAKQLLTPSANRNQTGCKQVYRHLKKGDVLLLNRQPTLHRPSIQAHRARILGGEKTLRLHYANCKAYNADFDGDEMNAHFPQDEIARAEAYQLVATDHQYLVPKDGTPLAGLIQDHMVSGVNLLLRGTTFNKSDYQQLVFCGLTDKSTPVKHLPPAYIKPQQLWTGKQVLSTVLLNIIPKNKPPLNLDGKAKISGKSWINGKPRPYIGGTMLPGDTMSESEVVIRGGELLVGVLDKGHYGNTPYSLVHCCYELYGGEIAGRLLTALARLFTTYLQLRGFTLGVEDILCTPPADKARRKIMKESAKCGPKVAAKAFNVKDTSDEALIESKMEEAHFDRESNTMQDLDLCMKGQTDEIQNSIVKVTMPVGLLKKFPQNNLQLMVNSGAKGSSVNCMQISCLLGQIELEGHRPPLMLNGRSLPSFQPFDMCPRAGGFIDGRFLTGIRPQEYFFHCMAGREGLVDTAVKTSRSGYLQRCIIKHLEGLTVSYDLTVRDSDGSIVQFQYGEDGLDILKTPFLKEKQFPFLINNHTAVASEKALRNVQEKLNTEKAPKLWKKFKKWQKQHPDTQKNDRFTPFLRYCRKRWKGVRHLAVEGNMAAVNKALVDEWKTMDDDLRNKYAKHTSRCPEPVNVQVNPAAHMGAVSERMESLINTYLDSQPSGISSDSSHTHNKDSVSADHFRTMMYKYNVESMVQPGEAVGLLAAQSIGEPSTQMTLNTFHFAGRGEMNVTLGIPRLREILMVASANIKTPSMDIPLLASPDVEKHGKELKYKFTKVYLSQVIEDVTVTESISIGEEKCRLYKVHFQFLPYDIYKEDLYVNPTKILSLVEKKFFTSLVAAINKKYRDIAQSTLLNTAFIRQRASRKEGEAPPDTEDVSDDDMHDDDATATKNREKQMDDLDYRGEEEEREEVGEDEEEEEDESDSDAASGEEDNNEEMNVDDDPLTPVTTKKKTPKKKRAKKAMSQDRIDEVKSRNSHIRNYAYDADEELWCEVTLQFKLQFQTKLDMTSLVDEEVRKMVLHQTPGIKRCFLAESKEIGEEGVLRIKTEGINLQVLPRYDHMLDLNKVYTNDIHQMVSYYGIEAAVQVIIREIRNVFAAYGIAVDYRHLSLVADYMTFEGTYKAFNRMGIGSNASALQKMTFETTMAFLKEATLSGAKEDLNSPSACLVVGQLVKGGTGAFDILQKIL